MTVRYWLETILAKFPTAPLRSTTLRRRPSALFATRVEALEQLTLLSMITANGDSAMGVHNLPITGSVLGNDYAMMDPITMTMPGPLSAELVTGPAHGTVTLYSDGGFTYTAAAGWAGSDTFSYQARDGASVSSPAMVSIMAMNSTPSASGGTYSVAHGQSVSGNLLQGAYDGDGDSMTALGVAGGGPTHGSVTINSNGSFTYTPSAGYAGSDNFSFKVTDGISESFASTIMLDVTNHAPSAGSVSYSATNTQTLSVGAPGVLSGSTDQDGDTMSASLFMQAMHGTVALSSDGSFTYTANAGYIGIDNFMFNVSDGLASGGMGSVTINVTQGAAAPPVVTKPANQTSLEHANISLAITATDPANSMLTYSASELPSGLSIDMMTGVISGTIAYGTTLHGPYTVQVTATNLQGLSDTKSFTWTVTPRAPYLSLPTDQSNKEHDTVSVVQSATDPGGYALTYSANGLPGGLSINSNTGMISGTIDYGTTAHGLWKVTIAVTNQFNLSDSEDFWWTITALPPYFPQDADAPGPRTDSEGAPVTHAVTAIDPGNYNLTYTVKNLPSGLSISSTTGVITGTIAYGTRAGGPYNVEVTASDPYASVTKSFTWTVNALPPVLTAPSNQTSVESDTTSLAVSATDLGGYALTYSATDLPAGLSIDAATGIISGTLGYKTAEDGPYDVKVTAADAYGSVTKSFTWTVNALPPVWGSLAGQTSDELDTPSVDVGAGASDPAGYELKFSAADLPQGLSINSFTGEISGTVNAGDAARGTNGVYTVTVTADNGYSTPASKTFTWTVHPKLTFTSLTVAPETISTAGGEVTLIGLCTDSSTITEPTVTVVWGDGKQNTYTIPIGQSGFAPKHQYEAVTNPVIYTISATVTDSGVTVSKSTTLNVKKLAVTSFAISPSTITSVGGHVTASGSYVDSSPLSTPTLTVNWGDGSSSPPITLAAGATALPSLTHDYGDISPSTYTVTATLVDGNLSASGNATLTVTQAPPLELNVTPLYLEQVFTTGGSVSVSGTFTDPYDSPIIEVSWDDGTTENAIISGGTFSASHIYGMINHTGDYLIGVTLSDHGDCRYQGVSLPITGPSVSPISDIIMTENSTATTSFELFQSAITPGATVYASASDNALLPVTATLSGTSGNVSLNPSQYRHGTTTVTVTVTDAAGVACSTSFQVTVNYVNSAPTGAPYAQEMPDGTATLIGNLNDVVFDLNVPVCLNIPDADELTFTLVENTDDGGVSLSADGHFTYTMLNGWLDPVMTFKWQVTDRYAASTPVYTATLDLTNDRYAQKTNDLKDDVHRRISLWYANSLAQLGNNRNAANAAIGKLQAFDSKAGQYFVAGTGVVAAGATLAFYTNPYVALVGTLATVGAGFTQGIGVLNANLDSLTAQIGEIYDADVIKNQGIEVTLQDQFKLYCLSQPTNRALSLYNGPIPEVVPREATAAEIDHLYGALLLQYAAGRGWNIDGNNLTGPYWSAPNGHQILFQIDDIDLANELNRIGYRPGA